MTYKVHPVAELFPLLAGEEWDTFLADIEEHGQREPVVLTLDQETILDGRNRLAACEKLGIEPHFCVLEVPEGTDAEDFTVSWILSVNIHRRHLTVGQAAWVGKGLEEYYVGPAKERQGTRTDLGNIVQSSGRSSRQAAKAVGVSHDSISKMKKIAAEEPELAEAVRAGEMSLDAAYKEMKARVKCRARPDPRPKPAKVFLTLRTHEGVEVPYPKPQAKPTFQTTNEQVDWAAWTWNPVTGCLHGCRYCYARELANKPSYATAYPVGFTPLFHEERLEAPANTRVPAEAVEDPPMGRVFVCSMADLYGKWVPGEWIHAVHASCSENPQWDYLLLTKFPSRYTEFELPPTAWAGTSVDTQRRVVIAERAMAAVEGVAVRWLSLEPLLEPLKFNDMSVFNFVVIGSQSATYQPDGYVAEFAPPFEWVAKLVAQAREAGCGVYLKPNLMGEVGPQCAGMQLPQEIPTPRKRHRARA